MIRKHKITLIFLLSFLFFSQTRYSPLKFKLDQSINYNVSASNKSQYNDGDYISTGFSEFELVQSKQREIDLEEKYNLTAVLLHWKRSQGIARSVDYLRDSKLFKEIIIWNNNPEINLTNTLFHKNTSSVTPIRIINSKKNLKDEAKYRACAAAKTVACFYGDDDWDTSFYLKSLIADFRTDPYTLHSVTDSGTFYANLMWTFFDKKIDLHTGFSWIGCGSIFLREHAERHIQYLETYLKNNSNLIYLGDVFFSIWLNDIPSQFNMDIRGLPGRDTHVSFSSTSNFLQLQHQSSVLAIRILEYNLRLNQSNNTDRIRFSRRQNRHFPYYVKSSDPNDEFIFFTNILPIDIEQISFNISTDFERSTRNNLPGGRNASFFVTHSTLQAVDNNPETCWHIGRNVRQGDFFAIDFLHIQTNLSFSLTIGHTHDLQNSLDMNLSFDGTWWITYRLSKGITIQSLNSTLNNPQYMMIFNSTQFHVGFHSFRFIAFNASRTSQLGEFQVCDVRIIRY